MPGHVDAFDPPSNFSGPSVTSGVSMPAERVRDIQAVKEEKNFREFMAATGRTDTDPYGNESPFKNLTGLKSNDYTTNVPGGLRGIATLNRLAYDRFMNPFAKRSILGQDVGGDMLRGKVREGVGVGDLTRYGRAEAAPRRGGFLEGLARFIPGIGAAMNINRPVVLPGFDMNARSNVPGYNESKLDQLQRLTPDIGPDSLGGLPPLSDSLVSDLPASVSEVYRSDRRDIDPPMTFLPDDLSGKSPFTSGGVPGVYPSDRRDIDPEMEQSAQTTDGSGLRRTVTLNDGRQVIVNRDNKVVAFLPSSFAEATPEVEARPEFGPDGVPKTRFEDITVDGNPLNTGRQSDPLFPMATGAYDAKLDEIERRNRQMLDQPIPSVSDVISGTSPGQPLDLIPPGFSTIGTNIVSQPVLNYPTFTEMMRRRRGNSPIIAQPL